MQIALTVVRPICLGVKPVGRSSALAGCSQNDAAVATIVCTAAAARLPYPLPLLC